jgi:hypothetical protein
MGFFDQFLAKVTPEDKAVLDRYPELQASVSKMEADLGTISKYAGDWVNWQNQNWDSEANMTKAEKTLRDELQAANVKLQAGVRSGADAGTVDALRKEFETKLAESNKQSMQAIEGMNLFYRAASTRMLPHQQEFKENLDPQVLMKFMQDNKINDPDIAYDKMVAGKRQELSAQAAKDLEAKHAADITAAEQRGADKKAQELAMGPGGMLPTDNTGGIVGVTARIDQPAKVSDAVKAQVSEAKLGDGSLAALGYQSWRSGELGPVQ